MPMEMLDLKAHREALGLSLQDAYQKTRICVKYLEAIEQANFACLPPPVYTRKFIREYTKLLGQESASYLNAYENYLKTSPVCSPITLIDSKQHTSRPAWSRKLIPKRKYLIISMSLIILMLVVLLFLSGNNRLSTITNLLTDLPTGKNDSPRQTDTPVAKDLPPAQTDVSPGKAPLPQRYHLSIEGREVTWLRIRVDNNPPYQLLLNPGEKIERFASQRFALDIGNAGGVILTFQGKDMGPIGKSGEVVHIRLP